MARSKAKIDESAVEEAEAEIQRALKAHRDTAEASQEAAAFAASPVGLAQAAKAAGRRYFQIVGDLTTPAPAARWQTSIPQQRHRDHAGLIESIEDQGWVLQDVGYVFEQTALDKMAFQRTAADEKRLAAAGQHTTVTGKLVAIYLFRVVAAKAPPQQPSRKNAMPSDRGGASSNGQRDAREP